MVTIAKCYLIIEHPEHLWDQLETLINDNIMETIQLLHSMSKLNRLSTLDIDSHVRLKITKLYPLIVRALRELVEVKY